MAVTKSAELKKLVLAAHLKNPDHPYYRFRELDKRFPKSGHTIKAWIEEMKGKEENKSFISNLYQEKINKENKNVFKFLEEDSEATTLAIQKIKGAIIAKATKASDDPFTSIKDLATAYGILIDKEIQVKTLAIKQAQLELERERMALIIEQSNNGSMETQDVVNVITQFLTEKAHAN